MIAMQYKVKLPDNYDMNLIRQRVLANGEKTDGFPELLFKAYLVSDRGITLEQENEYSPLYLWKSNEGMNKFIFGGFYNNILKSFGWQKINISIPLLWEMGEKFSSSKFVFEIESEIAKTEVMNPMDFSIDFGECTGKMLIYNPDKWKATEYYFSEIIPKDIPQLKRYEILHISM